MSLSADDVRWVAHLARLELSDAELETMTRQLSAICFRFESELFVNPSFTRAMMASKSAVLSALMTLKTMPASDVNRRVVGTAGVAAAG